MDFCPMLVRSWRRRLKDEYKRRLDDLPKDLEEAERFNDTSRAERPGGGALAEQLAAAVGLADGIDESVRERNARVPP